MVEVASTRQATMAITQGADLILEAATREVVDIQEVADIHAGDSEEPQGASPEGVGIQEVGTQGGVATLGVVITEEATHLVVVEDTGAEEAMTDIPTTSHMTNPQTMATLAIPKKRNMTRVIMKTNMKANMTSMSTMEIRGMRNTEVVHLCRILPKDSAHHHLPTPEQVHHMEDGAAQSKLATRKKMKG